MDFLTGQVPVGPPPCPNHKEVQHRDGQPKWCNRCGWHRGDPATEPKRLGNPVGGWGTP